MLKNTTQSWGSLAKSLHWMIAALIILEVPAGFLMSGTYALSFKDKDGLALHNLFSQIHHTTGFLILILAILRLAWRNSNTVPETLLAFRAQAWLSWLTHAGLYALLLMLPLSGWAALSSFGEAPIWLFNQAGLVPSIVPKMPLASTFGYSFFAGIHGWCYKIGAGLLVLHTGAALWHHFGRGDAVLTRMWPLGRDPDPRKLTWTPEKTR